ncbi:hypothetical protein H2248_003966 [Termitomyces sp. 'cryptogamus']|nr:hypothetical protein H2248_003966 [Termitomyces sp. 'cryptogamus']
MTLMSPLLLVMIDFPAIVGFLTPEERSYIIWKKKYDNSSVGEEEHFEMRHFWSAVRDWQIWLHILIYMSVIARHKSLQACHTDSNISHSLWNHTIPTEHHQFVRDIHYAHLLL